MVGGQGGPNSHPWCDLRGRFDLIAAELHHQPVGLGIAALQSLQHQLCPREAHVAAHGGIEPSVLKQVAHQVGNGGFAIGAGDADPGHVATGLESQLHFAFGAYS